MGGTEGRRLCLSWICAPSLLISGETLALASLLQFDLSLTHRYPRLNRLIVTIVLLF